MQVTPNMVTFSRAATAASELFALIDRESQINPFDESGDKPDETAGIINLQGINFSYPTRPDVTVLEDFTLNIPAGKVTALVVSSLKSCLLSKILIREEQGTIGIRKKHNYRSTRAVVQSQCRHHLLGWQGHWPARPQVAANQCSSGSTGKLPNAYLNFGNTLEQV